MKAWVIAQNEKAARELAAGVRTLADQVQLVALTDAAAVTGVADEVLKVAVPAGAMVESSVDTIAALVDAQSPEMIVAEPTAAIKVVIGRLAARRGTAVVTDAVKINADGTAEVMYFGGVGHRTVKPAATPAIYTASAATFGDAPAATGTDTVTEIAWVEPASALTVKSTEQLPKADVDLTAAKRIVGVGRGIAAEEDLQMVRDLCGKMGAELGCSRPVAEAEGWLPREAYIGVSGVVTNPDVYLALGISGQMQHMVGVSNAKIIFAINKDKTAPIFNQADYGLVGDIYDVVPKLAEKLQ